MHKPFIVTAFMLGALAVFLGAFGAHGLKNFVGDQQLITYETAVRYQFYHVFALALTGIIYKSIPTNKVRIAGRFFIAGIVFFSGSLYLMTILAIFQVNNMGWIGAITPVGGAFLIAGWLLLAMEFHRKYN
jgi:uncharacterized membrane protein YgdD (TMEM256/DUF423 family)